MSEVVTTAQFPAKLKPLFTPRRYKVMHGGRGGGKSWAVARALLIKASSEKIRVLCAREIQKSMKESVHRLLKEQIEELGLGADFEVLETEIRCVNGSVFVFTGLQSHTVDSIKSFEGVDIVWVEEAHGVSKKSWDTLIPTIRKPGSEIWMTLNPDMDTDETWVRFIASPSDDTWVCEVNWRDNPWFPAVLEQERLKAYARDVDGDYDHIWEGKPRRVAAGAIYRHEIDALYAERRVCPVPYDPSMPVHTVWDLGWNDAMVILMVQRGPQDVRILDHIEDSNRTLDWYVAQINKRPYNWGTDYLPHDGRTKNFQTGKSTEQLLREMGRRDVRVLGVQPIEEGIKAARMVFPRCFFDSHKTARLVECLKRYRRDISQKTNEPGGPLHDEFSHSCLVGSTLIATSRGDIQIKDVTVGDLVLTPAGLSLVMNAGQTKYATDLIEITADDGSILVATPEHKIFTTRGVVRADELRYDDCVYNHRSYPCLSSQSIASMGYRDALIESFKVLDTGSGQNETSTSVRLVGFSVCFTSRFTQPYTESLSVIGGAALRMAITATSLLTTGFSSAMKKAGSILSKSLKVCVFTGRERATTRHPQTLMAASPCTDSFGRTTTEPYRLATTSTTLTGTSPTTQLRTWSYFLSLITQGTIPLITSGLEAVKTKTKSQPPVNWQKSGTLVRMAGSGTQITPYQLGKIASGLPSTASSAEKSLKRRTQLAPSSATKIARLRRYEPEEKTPVYDLTIEHHHCYFAGGVLVSNCDAFRYLGQAVSIMPSAGSSSAHDYEPPPPPDWRM